MKMSLANKISLRPVESSDDMCSWLWLGTWSMGGEGWGGSDEGECRAVLEKAIEKDIFILFISAELKQGIHTMNMALGLIDR